MTTVSGCVYDTSGSPVSNVVVRAYRRDTGALIKELYTGDGTNPVMINDAAFSQVQLLLHGEGGTADSSGAARSPTSSTGVTASGTQYKYGTQSLNFSGSGGLTYAHASSLDLGSGDFTCEAWIYFPNTTSRYIICGCIPATGATANTSFWLERNSSGKLSAPLVNSSGTTFITLTGTTTTTASAWHHVALVRYGNVFTLYLDGNAEAAYIGSQTMNPANNSFGVGCGGDYTGSPLTGYMDEFRLTVGMARYTSAFAGSLPAASFPPTAGPVLPVGQYSIDLSGYAGEIQVVALDDAGGTLENDQILRTYGV